MITGDHVVTASAIAKELGILLDVFVLVFVMGIALFQISREFQHIDSNRLNQLGDWTMPEKEEIEEVEQ